jgi:hypothetical protein
MRGLMRGQAGGACVLYFSDSALRGLRLLFFRLSLTGLASSFFRLSLTGLASFVFLTQPYGACVFQYPETQPYGVLFLVSEVKLQSFKADKIAI